MPSPVPVGSRCQGCYAPGSEPGSPLTSAAHRLLTDMNDPEVTWAMPLHPNSATGYCGCGCRSRCTLFLFRTLATAPVADAETSSAQFSISCNSG